MSSGRIVFVISALALLAGCGGAKPATDGASASAPASPASSSASAMPDATPAAAPAPPKPTQPPDVPPPPPDHPLDIGTQDAKDDLYCSGVIFAANPTPDSALNPVDQAVLEKNQMLGVALAENGVNKLIDQKVAHATHAAFISNAYADKAEADIKAKKARISLEKCVARAKALPPPPQ